MPPQTPSPNEGPSRGERAHIAALAAVAEAYAKRRGELANEARELGLRSGRVSALRGVTFLVAGALTAYAFLGSSSSPLVAVAAAAFGAAFVALVIAHAVLITREDAIEQRIRLVDQATLRISTRPKRSAAAQGKDAPARGVAGEKRGQARVSAPRSPRPAPPDHPYAKDLDIFGERDRSLFEIIDMTQTEPGESTLSSWLASPASPAEIAERQEAIRELANEARFREDLAIEGIRAETRGRPCEPLCAWAEARPVLALALTPNGEPSAEASASSSSSRARILAAGGLVAATLVLFTLDQAFGAALLGPYRRAWLATLVVQIAILGSLNRTLAPLLSAASSKQAPFGRYRALFDRVERHSVSAPMLTKAQDALRGAPGSGGEASAAMRSLESIIGYADLRHSGFFYLFINVFLLWDLWCALALDRWRARAGKHVRAWFEALGQIEALASLATYTYERPDHTFPEVVLGPPVFEASGLGHPMIPPDVRVANDVSFAKPGQALLITGSNMSGKSTLLRAIGVNAVLAQAGAPVCAERLRMSPLAVRTSMRIDDSLDQGVSHFYAELARLKSIVDAADAGSSVLFLLDEVLHGTNSRERHIGAKAVVLHLLDRGAIGALTSHDLALADLAEASAGRVSIVHFEEIIRDGRMAFDYTLKPGVVRTTNALRLMRLVGLDIDIPGLDGDEGAPRV